MKIPFSDRRHGKCQWVWCVQRACLAYSFEWDEEQQRPQETISKFVSHYCRWINVICTGFIESSGNISIFQLISLRMLRTNDKRQLYSKLIRASYMIAANNSRFVIELRAVHGKMQFGDVENAIILCLIGTWLRLYFMFVCKCPCPCVCELQFMIHFQTTKE